MICGVWRSFFSADEVGNIFPVPLPCNFCHITRAESCWQVYSNCCWNKKKSTKACTTTTLYFGDYDWGVWRACKTLWRHASLLMLTPSSRETKGVSPVVQILAQTIMAIGTCRRGATSDIPGGFIDRFPSFWQLCACSTVNSISRVKRTCCHLPRAVRHSSPWHLLKRTVLFSSVQYSALWSL